MVNSNRWNLLTKFVKVVVFLYIILAIWLIIALSLTLLGFSFPLSIYGINSKNQFSLIGITILFLFLVKGIVGYLFLTGNKKAIYFGIFDTIIGIFLCIYVGFIYPFFDDRESVDLVFRLELLFLSPLLIALFRLKKAWLNPFQPVE